MIEAPSDNILAFPPVMDREEVIRLWQDFQAAIAEADAATARARAASDRFRAAFLAWERRQ
jgi:hypothetical protein